MDSAAPSSDAPVPASESLDSIVKGLKPIVRERVGAIERQIGDIEATASRDTKRVENAYKSTGIDPGDFKPWDAEHESAKRRTDPVEAFGSLGSVFGILASAFTHAPMANAMNASASAINAVRAGNAEDYDRAAKAWHDNTQLALERNKIQQDAYRDAIELMKTNMALGTQRLQLLAARFDDKQILYLLDHGMNKDAIQLATTRQDLSSKIEEDKIKWTRDNIMMSDLYERGYKQASDGQPLTSEQKKNNVRVLQEWNKDWSPYGRNSVTSNDPIKRQLDAIWADPDLRWDEKVSQTTEIMQAYKGGPTLPQVAAGAAAADIKGGTKPGEAITQAATALRPPPNTLATQAGRAVDEEVTGGKTRTQAIGEVAPALKPPINTGRSMDANEVNRRRDEYIAAGMKPDAAFDKARREVAADAKSITGNRADDIQKSIDRIGVMRDNIGKVETLLKKHGFITGFGGSVTRPSEAVGNALGLSNATDRKEFERLVSELQLDAPRVLTGSDGRPLSVEAGKISTIIAGLKPGDTAANTARAYKEILDELGKMEERLRDRKGGEGSSPPAGKPPPSDAPKPKWQSAPLVGQ